MTWPDTASPSARPTRRAVLGWVAGAGAVGAVGLAGCTSVDLPGGSADDEAAAGAVPVPDPTWPVVAAGDAAASAIAVSAALVDSSPAAVVLHPDAPEQAVTDAAAAAVAAGVPCLVDGPDLGAELDRLGVESVLRMGAPDEEAGGTPFGPAVSSREGVDDLPPVTRDAPLRVVVTTPDEPAHAAALATVRAVLGQHGDSEVLTADDPREDEVMTSLRRLDDTPLVVLGESDDLGGDALVVAAAMAARATELPTGGVLPLGGDRRMIALYGHPGVPGLGLLGEQDVDASVERVSDLVDEYAQTTGDTFLPAFEIIATIADSSPGADGDYSSEGDPSTYRPWVDAAHDDGVYVLLDLQSGRADFLSQAKRYEELLLEPHVGLALDPEWRLEPGQRPLEQIGHVEVDEVEEVADWLAELVREHDLPQKVFMLHQFQLQMLRDRDQLRTDHPELVTVVHADGHGTPELKQQTWDAVRAELPDGVELGWKNFIDEDTPTFTPRQTMLDVRPRPRFVSYQ
ncbi:hypothetical protein M3697_13230 [Janibacter melonis]|uniref:hypothetical protein n=1 Tax=Janibacter melonis TaxID=262209 RepID=UPI002043F409|nr:hypothetical protein [Janibacter melonis]MCM3556058.1 hypothetical protein [Janibacter melonis]